MGAKRRPADRRDAPFPRLRSCGKPLARLFDIHSLQSEQVFAQNLALGLFGELRVAVAFDQVLWQLEVSEGVQSPLRVLYGGLKAVDALVLSAPRTHNLLHATPPLAESPRPSSNTEYSLLPTQITVNKVM